MSNDPDSRLNMKQLLNHLAYFAACCCIGSITFLKPSMVVPWCSRHDFCSVLYFVLVEMALGNRYASWHSVHQVLFIYPCHASDADPDRR